MSRLGAMSRLAVAYGRHQVRRRFRPGGAQLNAMLGRLGAEHIRPLTREERALLPAMSRCINCGLCALVAQRRAGEISPPDLASSYLRAFHRLPDAVDDVDTKVSDLEAAADACPVAVPIPAIALIVERLARQDA